MDLAIRNGTIVSAIETFQADIGISEGKIAQMGGEIPKAKKEIDASQLMVMPGAIDVHTHLNMPFMGTFTADDFETGTIAAAAGGVTSLIDFAIQPEGNNLLETLKIWKEKAADKAVVDYSFHIAVTSWDESMTEQVATLVKAGFPSFKVFMAYKGSLMLEDAGLLRLLQTAHDHQALVMVHAENGDAVYTLQQQAMARGDYEPKFHEATRPRAVEGEATARAIALAQVAEAPIYIVHVSCQEALRHIRAARRMGLPVYAETCPQYLGAISMEDYERPDFEGAKYVCSPPLRELNQSGSMWSGLSSSALQLVSSDHCPFRFDQKKAGIDDFTLIPNGVPGIETLVALVWSLGVGRGLITPNRFVELVSTAPARNFGMLPHKGSLSVGADADVMLFDPELETELRASNLHQNLDYTPYEGFQCKGYPVTTISRGDVIWEDGKSNALPGRGKIMQRQPFAQPAVHELVA